MKRRTGVILKLVESCAKLKTNEKQMYEALLAALQKKGANSEATFNIIHSLLYLDVWQNENKPQRRRRYKEEYNEGGEVSTLGSLILQNLLKFQPKKCPNFYHSFEVIDIDNLLAFTCHPKASHVIESFIDSLVDISVKSKFVEKFETHIAELCQDKYGSHCIEKCYENVSVSTREWIVEELIQKEAVLSNDYYGHFIMRRCRVDLFKSNREVWKQKERQGEKKKSI